MANSALTGIVAGAASQAEQEAGSSTTVYVSPGRQQFHPSAAKAWVNFNGTGTVAIREAYNVTSITDNNTGYYTVNFTTPMSSSNYCVAASTQVAAGASTAVWPFSGQSGGTFNTQAPSTSSFTLLTAQAGSAADLPYVLAVVYGDM